MSEVEAYAEKADQHSGAAVEYACAIVADTFGKPAKVCRQQLSQLLVPSRGHPCLSNRLLLAENMPLFVPEWAVDVAGSGNGHGASQIHRQQGADGVDTTQLYRGPPA